MKKYLFIPLLIFSGCNILGNKESSSNSNITQTNALSANFKILSAEKLNPVPKSLTVKIRIQNTGQLQAKNVKITGQVKNFQNEDTKTPFIVFKNGDAFDIGEIQEEDLKIFDSNDIVREFLKEIIYKISWQNFNSGILSSEINVITDTTITSFSDTDYNYNSAVVIASNLYNQAENTLKSIGASLSFTDISQFRSGSTDTSAISSLFGSQGQGFDTTKFGDLESAIGSMQSAVAQLSQAPRKVNPMLVTTANDSDKAFINLYLGFLYTLDAYWRIKVVYNDAVTILNSRYSLNTTYNSAQELYEARGKNAIQALLDAYWLIAGTKKQVTITIGGVQTTLKSGAAANSPSSNYVGSTKCAAYQFSQCLDLIKTILPKFEDGITKLKNEGFGNFRSEFDTVLLKLGITDAQ